MNEKFLISYLKEYSDFYHSSLSDEEKIRCMMNRCMPYNLSDEFYSKQDEYLKDILSKKEIIDVDKLIYKDSIALVKGDITLIKADAIVNAGNSQLLGCFVPLHKCIDNCIHSFAGLEVRRDLIKILRGRHVNNAEVVITSGHNLPSKYIFHTVGPIYNGTKQNEIDLANCYVNCLKEADKLNLKSIVFCSLSTGVFGYPIVEASSIAVRSVRKYLKDTNSKIKVVFDLFSERDYLAYERFFK